MKNDLATVTLRKIFIRIVPFTMLLYFIAFVDRVNIGFAALTMNNSLGFSPKVFGLGAAIFFLGYFLFEVPSNLILYRVGARLWIACVMITWGFVSCAMIFVQGPFSFYVLRFLLGVAEAGFFPGVILYLTHWFPTHKRAAAVAIFMSGAPVSTALGSPISAALLQLHGLGLAGWQWLFLLEAAPAIIFGILVLYFLTNHPENARWLSEAERAWLMTAMRTEQTKMTAYSFWRGLYDPRVCALSLIYFGTSAGLYVLSIWSAQIFAQLKLTIMQVGFVNSVLGFIAIPTMVLWSLNSDHTRERVWHVVSACLLAAAGLFYAGIATTLINVVIALTIANIGVSAAKPPLWSLSTSFLSGPSAAGGIAAINALGNLGGFVGPFMVGWIKAETGSFQGGLYLTGALMITSALATLMLARVGRRGTGLASPFRF